MKKVVFSILICLSLLTSSPITPFAKTNEFEYNGALKDGKYEGVGELTYLEHLVYEGGFKEGLYDGAGTLYYPDRTIDASQVVEPIGNENVNHMQYVGEFKTGLYHGKGTSYYEIFFPGEKYLDYKGVQYEGKFRYDQYSGYGTLYSMEGNITHQGYFLEGNAMMYEGLKDEKGLMNGTGILKDSENQIMFEGTFKHGEIEGTGTLYDPSISWKYTGQFKGDDFHGNGKIFNGDKLYYEGEFFKGSKEGQGTLYDVDGGVLYKGSFKEDRPAILPFQIHNELKIDENLETTYSINILLNDKVKTATTEKQLSKMKKNLTEMYGETTDISSGDYKGFKVTTNVESLEEGFIDRFSGVKVHFVKTRNLFTNQYTSYINPSSSYDGNIIDFSISYALSNELNEVHSQNLIMNEKDFSSIQWIEKDGQEMINVQFESPNVLKTIAFIIFILVFLAGFLYFKRTDKNKKLRKEKNNE